MAVAMPDTTVVETMSDFDVAELDRQEHEPPGGWADLDTDGLQASDWNVTPEASIDPVTPVTLSLSDAVASPNSDGVTGAVTIFTPHTSDKTPDQRGVDALDSDKVTGVTPPVGSVSPLHGLVTGAWLESQTFPDVEYVVPRLIPEGFTLLVGAPKAGKSWLVLSIGLSVAAGGSVLGQPLDARPVLYLAMEDSHRRLRYRAKTLYPAGLLPDDWHVMLHIPPGAGADDVIEAWLESLPRTVSPPLVIVDTLGKVRPGRRPAEGVYEYDYRIGGRMKRLADSWPGAALVAVHHDRKAGAVDFVDDVSGSNGLAGAADTIVIVRRDRNGHEGLFLVTGRDVTEGAYAAEFHEGHWSLAGGGFDAAAESYTATAAAMGKGDTAQQIVRWVAANQPTSPKAVAEALNLAPDSVRQAMTRLAKEDRLDRAAGRYFLPDFNPNDHQENPA